LSLDAAERSESFVTSVVYGTDALARLSLHSIENLRKRVIDTIFDCTTPKVRSTFYCIIQSEYNMKLTRDFS
jgi:hypothetical protein